MNPELFKLEEAFWKSQAERSKYVLAAFIYITLAAASLLVAVGFIGLAAWHFGVRLVRGLTGLVLKRKS